MNKNQLEELKNIYQLLKGKSIIEIDNEDDGYLDMDTKSFTLTHYGNEEIDLRGIYIWDQENISYEIYDCNKEEIKYIKGAINE